MKRYISPVQRPDLSFHAALRRRKNMLRAGLACPHSGTACSSSLTKGSSSSSSSSGCALAPNRARAAGGGRAPASVVPSVGRVRRCSATSLVPVAGVPKRSSQQWNIVCAYAARTCAAGRHSATSRTRSSSTLVVGATGLLGRAVVDHFGAMKN